MRTLLLSANIPSKMIMGDFLIGTHLSVLSREVPLMGAEIIGWDGGVFSSE